jgi:autotransporter passenger strand-loop-strand repeat protein
VVWSGGYADHTTVTGKGSFDFVVGSAYGDVINNGTEFVISGGNVTSTTVNSGGVEAVYGSGSNGSGSEAYDDIINRGGYELVSGGGIDDDGTVRGIQFVENGGQTYGTDVVAGGAQIVQAGGIARSDINGGLVDVQANGTAFVSFDNINGGTLDLESPQTFSGTIANFASPPGVAEVIDLGGLAFGGGSKATFTEAGTGTSGTLSVTNGSQTDNITLLGSYSTGNFHIASDGNGGTVVTDPPLTADNTQNPTLAAHA